MATDATPTLAEQILNASEAAWKKLRQALRVDTREEAINLVTSDEEAATTARSILYSGSALTNTKTPMSALTQPAVKIPTAKGRQPRMQF